MSEYKGKNTAKIMWDHINMLAFRSQAMADIEEGFAAGRLRGQRRQPAEGHVRVGGGDDVVGL